MYPDSAGMSVDYGLNGSLFLPLGLWKSSTFEKTFKGVPPGT